MTFGATHSIFQSLDDKIGACSGPLGSAFGPFGELESHFGDTLFIVDRNVEPYPTYRKPSFFIGFLRLEGVWRDLDGHLSGLGCKCAGGVAPGRDLGGIWRRLGGSAAGWLAGRKAPG